MSSSWLRLFYVIEFLLAVQVTFLVWAEIGGQSHLDLMPWYWKALLGFGLAIAVVQATAAAVNGERFLNGRSAVWLSVAAAVILSMGYVTYLAHLQEEAEDEERFETIGGYPAGPAMKRPI
ncbi:MAG: hypothetical protein ACK5AZ_06185 [Bryobacteraceae bacterium]